METGAVKTTWVIELPLAAAGALGPMRRVEGLSVCATSDRLWLGGEVVGDDLDDALRKRLLALPAFERYFVGPAKALTPWQRLTPRGFLPEGPWQPLEDWLELALPTSGWPGERPASLVLTLARDSAERPTAALLVAWSAWAEYCKLAPEARLDGLSFAANAHGEAVVRGELLPPLPGVHLTHESGIFAPAGWSWNPRIDGAAARRVLGLAEGESALWLQPGSWQRLARDVWVKATRSAVRATSQEMSHVE